MRWEYVKVEQRKTTSFEMFWIYEDDQTERQTEKSPWNRKETILPMPYICHLFSKADFEDQTFDRYWVLKLQQKCINKLTKAFAESGHSTFSLGLFTHVRK